MNYEYSDFWSTQINFSLKLILLKMSISGLSSTHCEDDGVT